MNEISVAKIKKELGIPIEDVDYEIYISSFSNVQWAESGDIAFWSGGNADFEPFASAILVPKYVSIPEIWKENSRILPVNNPKKEFVKIVYKYFLTKEDKRFKIDPTAVIYRKHVILASDVKIGPNCSIGYEGFGYVRYGQEWVHFPHISKVFIETDVEIGANCCIDRGALSPTVIRKGVKIDNHVHVAHGVEIGENTIIVANTFIGGSAKIGKSCWIGPNVCIRDHVEIGDNCMIGMGSVVTKDIPAGSVAYGSPAKVVRQKTEKDF